MENLKMPRLSTEQERRQIKIRTHQSMEQAGGPEFFAPVTPVNKAQLSKYGSLSEPDCFIRADVMLELDRQIGAPLMVGTLAAMLGYKLVPAEAEAQGEDVGFSDLSAIVGETGDVVKLLVEVLADGKIDASERRQLAKEVTEALTAFMRLDGKVVAGRFSGKKLGGAK